MHLRRLPLLLPALIALISLTACAGGSTVGATAADEDGHSERAGAAEVEEAPLALMSVDAEGSVAVLDLLSGESSDLGGVGAPTALASDGRYGFVTTSAGLDVVDSGRWTWIHGDHNHYYLGEPKRIGTLSGAGDATVTTSLVPTDGSTGVYFAGSSEAVLLDNAALDDGEIVEVFRVTLDSPSGLIAPLHEGALVTDGDELVFYDDTGAAGAATTCVDAAGSITTSVGLVVGCADGALLATGDDDAPAFETIAYPSDVDAERARSFDGRKGRPTVAAVSGTSGFWILDTRERTWQHVPTDEPLALVSAVDDEAGHVVAVDTAGRVRVFLAASGEESATTEPLVSEMDDTVSLTVDAQRAYVNDPASGTVLEVDFADDARIARALETPTAPFLVAEVGR